MKYLFITLFFTVSSAILTAQDTLYVKGEENPLLVNITVVRPYSLNYTKSKNGLIHTVKMEDVKSIKFQKDLRVNNTRREASLTQSTTKLKSLEFEESSSTISAKLTWRRGRYYTGLSYLRRIESLQSKSGRFNYFINIGGAYFDSRFGISQSNRNRLRRSFLEFGFRAEFYVKGKPSNRFHFGMDFNNHWEEINTFTLLGEKMDISTISKFAIQIPIGYTYRAPEGFYLDGGLKFTNVEYFIELYLGLGIAF